MAQSTRTSLITFISTEHGRMRRHQRDIDKRDIRRAIKYGDREKSYRGRWKITYDGIIFIADQHMLSEVTAYPKPLEFASVDRKAEADHVKAKLVLERKPELCGSHTVLVVDNSGSMATHDIVHHRDRQTAAYSVTALEMVAEQLFNGTANNSDVVSLVEFNASVRVVFQREPISWELYNKLLARRSDSGFLSRRSARVHDMVHGDSNYLPAMEKAEELLSIGNHEACALSLFFVSDGAPTDARLLGLTPNAALGRMKVWAARLAKNFGDQLSVSMVGFGNVATDFDSMKQLVQAFNDSLEGMGERKGAEFLYCNKMANGISTAISSLVTSTTKTRLMLSERDKLKGRTKRNVLPEIDTSSVDGFKYYEILDHFVFQTQRRDFVHWEGLPPGAFCSVREEKLHMMTRARQSRPPPFLALNQLHCGEGSERLAFRCQLSNGVQKQNFAFSPMVAKETNLVERIEEQIQFHKGFCETQSLASYLALQFNQRLQALPGYDPQRTPNIAFIPCSVLLLKDPSWPNGTRGVLVEKMLDVELFKWQKWNDNAGGIDGIRARMPIDVDFEMEQLDNTEMGTDAIIEEGDEDEESEESDLFECSDDGISESDDDSEMSDRSKQGVEPKDYLQAFTHFSYRFTNAKVLVCDLQGIHNTSLCPPTFELTDPAIHYASKSGREMVFGRTDKGKQGINLFFKTHKCTEICKMLQLSRKNKDWRQSWRQSYGEGTSGRAPKAGSGSKNN